MLLQYGDDPEIEPGDLWVRVVPEADGPEDYERSLKAFVDTHLAGMEQLPSYLAGKLREIRILEFTFNTPVTRDGHGPRMSMLVGQKLSDYQQSEHGEDTFELTRLGPAGLETLDALTIPPLPGPSNRTVQRVPWSSTAHSWSYGRLCGPALENSRSVPGPPGGQCMRMTTVITASVPIRTSDIRCSTAGGPPLATRSARPMGVTRSAQLKGRDGGGGLPGGANMVRCSMPRLRSWFSRSRDRALMAA